MCVFFFFEFVAIFAVQKKRNFWQNCWKRFCCRILCYFWVCCNFCSSEELEFVAELLHKILLQNFFVILIFLQFLQFRRRGICCRIFSVVLSVLQQSFLQVAEFLFCFGVWNCSRFLLHFQEKRLCCRNFVLFWSVLLQRKKLQFSRSEFFCCFWSVLQQSFCSLGEEKFFSDFCCCFGVCCSNLWRLKRRDRAERRRRRHFCSEHDRNGVSSSCCCYRGNNSTRQSSFRRRNNQEMTWQGTPEEGRKEKRRKNKQGCCTVVLKICMQIRFPSKHGFPFLDRNISWWWRFYYHVVGFVILFCNLLFGVFCTPWFSMRILVVSSRTYFCHALFLVGSPFQGGDIGMHPERGQSLVVLHSRVMWSPV